MDRDFTSWGKDVQNTFNLRGAFPRREGFRVGPLQNADLYKNQLARKELFQRTEVIDFILA